MIVCLHRVVGLVTGKVCIKSLHEGLHITMEMILINEIERGPVGCSMFHKGFPLRNYVLCNMNERSFCPSWFFLEELEDELLAAVFCAFIHDVFAF